MQTQFKHLLNLSNILESESTTVSDLVEYILNSKNLNTPVFKAIQNLLSVFDNKDNSGEFNREKAVEGMLKRVVIPAMKDLTNSPISAKDQLEAAGQLIYIYMNNRKEFVDAKMLKESEQLDIVIEEDIEALEQEYLKCSNILASADDYEDDYIEYIKYKVDVIKSNLEYLGWTEATSPFSDEDDDIDNDMSVNENVSYNKSEMVEILTMIRDGQIKKVFNTIKEKDNVTLLDVVRVLVAKDKASYIPRLIELGVQSGSIKI